MLDIMIAIFLIYALFAGLVSGINELVIQGLSLRGKVLFEGIAIMLGELSQKTHKPGILKSFGIKDAKLSEELYQHPLINSLSPAGCSRPSYISPQTFSSALVQVLSKDGSLTALRQALDDRNTPLGQLLGPMLDEASGDLEKFKAKVEEHFNAVTDRVSGWFKRRTQFVMFLIGFVLAILFNVDSIHIVQRLQKNPAQVEELVKLADKLSTQMEEKKKQAPAAGVGDVSPVVGESREENITYQDLKKNTDDLVNEINKFRNMGLPIGWDFSSQDLEQKLPYPQHQDTRLSWLGWFLTALAGTFGAPFWFDALSKLFAIRGAGKRPEEAAPPATPSVSVQVSTPAVASPAAPQDVPLNDYEASRLNGDDIEGLQRALGMPAAKINGKLSEELRQALREWQRITGRTVTGQFDEPTVLALLYPESKGE